MVSGPLISGIASLIVGIIAIIIGVVISQAVKTAIHDGVEAAVKIKSNTSENYEGWKANTAGVAAQAFRSFYLYNITNMAQVVKLNAVPTYEEVGPFVYQYLYEKIDVSINKSTHSAKFRNYNRYIFRGDKSVSSDKVDIFQVNPAYILAAYTNLRPDQPSKPVPAAEPGVLASIVSGAFSQVYGSIGPSSSFPGLIKTNYFQPTFTNYRKLIIGYKYGGNTPNFVAALNGTINWSADNCSAVPAAAQASCNMFNAVYSYPITFTGVRSAVVAKLMDDTNVGGLLHSNNLWIKALLNKVNDSPNPIYYKPAATAVEATSTEVMKIFAWIESYINKQELAILRYWLGWGSEFTYEKAGYLQFASLKPLNGLSLRHQNPSTAFYPDFQGYYMYEIGANVPMSQDTAEALFSPMTVNGVLYKEGIRNPVIIGTILRLNQNAAVMAQVGFANIQQAAAFVPFAVSIYLATMTPLCNQMNAYGTCFYRRTSVQNLLFGTTEDPMVVFFSKGLRKSAGIFTNHTDYTAARSNNMFGDEVDIGTSDVDDIGKIYRINGAKNIVRNDGITNSWNGTVAITGRGVQFPPFSKDSYTQAIYSTSLYRNLNLKKIGDATVKGVDMRHFQVDPANYAATTSNKLTYFIKYDGVMDFSYTELVAGAPNIPILGTNPHLFDTDRTLFQGISCKVSSVDSDDDECFTDETQDSNPTLRNKFTTNFYIEPITGIPMKGNAALQFWINVDATAKKDVFSLKALLTGTPFSTLGVLDNHIPDRPIPVVYLRDTVELTDDNADDFKNSIYAAQKMGKTIGVALPVIGAFLLVFSFALLYWHVKLVKEGNSVNKP